MYEEINLESIDFSTTSTTYNNNYNNNNTEITLDTETTENTAANQPQSVAVTSDQITWLSHNSLLNCLFILTNKNQLFLYDCNSKNILKRVDLNSTDASKGKVTHNFLNKISNHFHLYLKLFRLRFCANLQHPGQVYSRLQSYNM